MADREGTEMIVLDTQNAHLRHDTVRTVLLENDGARFRATIRVDFYDFQSRATIEVWDNSQWNDVAVIPYSLMRSAGKWGKSDINDAMDHDQRELIRLATLVVAGSPS